MKKIILVILVILPLVSYAQANKIYRKALKSTDLKERIELFTQVIALEPKNYDAYFLRAVAKNDLGDYQGAIVDYSKIIVFEPTPETFFNRGNSKYSNQDFQGAKEDYQKAIELDPHFIDAIYSLACTKYDLQEYKGAIEDFTNALNKEPLLVNAYKLRASAYRMDKEYFKALKDYNYAVMISPSSDTYFDRGEFYTEINYYKNANNDFTRAIRLNPNNSFALFYRGTTHFLLGKYKKAILDFNKALEFDSTDFDALLGLALVYHKLNDINKAKLNLKKAEKILSPNTPNNKGIKLFENTYWYKNKNYVFSKNYKEIINY